MLDRKSRGPTRNGARRAGAGGAGGRRPGGERESVSIGEWGAEWGVGREVLGVYPRVAGGRVELVPPPSQPRAPAREATAAEGPAPEVPATAAMECLGR